jgi:hypothetical protein
MGGESYDRGALGIVRSVYAELLEFGNLNFGELGGLNPRLGKEISLRVNTGPCWAVER